ncbi:hypothetical protein K505DRAFT_201995, partial [Melanomma pulvis-pyrius CBS 109.77]
NQPQPAFPFFTYVNYPLRHRPAEYVEGEGWYQGGHRLRRVKPYKHLIWPRDGKRGSTWGRMKDIIQGKGPDIHVALSADKTDYMWNRPRRARWSRHTNLDDRGPDAALKYEFPWARREDTMKCYDFRTRKYCRPNRYMWTDAVWPDEPNDEFVYPYAMRDIRGEWIQ